MNRRTFLTSSAMLAGASALPLLSGRSLAQTAAAPAASGMDYAPQGKVEPVVKGDEFIFAAAHLDHGHINGMCGGLSDAGGQLKWVYEPDDKKVRDFMKRYPKAKRARSLDEVLADPEVRLVAAAAITSERGPIGCRVMEGGKDYFTDKAPFTTMEQLEQARIVAARTGKKYMVYYSERLHNRCAMYATDLVKQGAVGRVLQVIGFGPHRLQKKSRPAWFFERDKFGGILCDIGSHQFEQFLTFAGATDASIGYAAIANFENKDHPGFEDFGEAVLVGNNGTSNYVRVDWFTPDGLSTWGDGRTIILGTKGTIELRKYVDIARDRKGDHVYIADEKGERHIQVGNDYGFRFFGELILDSLNRTELAMTQAHAFKAAELSIRAQNAARQLA